MKFNPLLLFNIPLIIFLLIDIGLIVFLFKIHHANILTYAVLTVIAILMLILLFLLNKGMIVSAKTLQQIEERKQRIIYFDDGFYIDYPLSQIKEKVIWDNVQAVFLRSFPPREGEYHTLEYIVFLNQPPSTIPYEDLRWYNKISFSPSKNSYIKINDFDNKNFDTFGNQLCQHLKGILLS